MISMSEGNICRLCTNQGHNYHPIFDTNTDAIAEKINKCLPIVIDSNDQLPTHICNCCLEALNVSDKLRTQSLVADSILRKQLDVLLLKNVKQEVDLFENEDNVSDECDAVEEAVPPRRAPTWICKFCSTEFTTPDNLEQHKYRKHYLENEYDIEMNKDSDTNDNFIDVNNLDLPVIKHEDSLVSRSTPIEHESGNEQNNAHEPEQLHVDELENKNGEQESNESTSSEGKNDTDQLMNGSINIKDEAIAQVACSPRLSTNEGEDETYCKICDCTIGDKELMQLHHKFHQPRGMFCGRCLRTFPSPYDLYMHKKNGHGMWANLQMKWFCERCEKMISGGKYVLKHIKKCTKPTFKCKYCEQAFAYKSQLMTHQRKTHHDLILKDPDFPKYTCDLCNKTYLDKPTYGDHMRKHKAKEDESFKCPYCAKISTCKLDLNDHIQRRHERKSKFKCTSCPRAFHSEKDLQTHRRVDHSFTCTMCYKQYEDPTLLDQHLLDDHNTQAQTTNKYSCQECNVTFTRRKYYQDHQNVHTGKQPYACKICGKKFSNYSTYYGHQRHHKKPSFTCDYCKKSFSSKCGLREHIPQHQPQKDWPFDCEICKMKFRSDTTLRCHIKKYKDTHLRPCAICGVELLGMRKFSKHMRQKHNL